MQKLAQGWIRAAVVTMGVAMMGVSSAAADPFDVIRQHKGEFSQIDPNVGEFSDQYQRDRAENLNFAQNQQFRNLQMQDLANRQRMLQQSVNGRTSPAQQAWVRSEVARLESQKQSIMYSGQMEQGAHNQRITDRGRKTGPENRPGSYFGPSSYGKAWIPQRQAGVYARSKSVPYTLPERGERPYRRNRSYPTRAGGPDIQGRR